MLTGSASQIVINPGTGTGTTLTITSPTVTTAAGSSLNFNYTAGTSSTAVVAWNPSLTSGIIGSAYTVTDTGGTGFATVVGGDVVRLTGSNGGTILNATNATTSTGATNFITTPASDGTYTSNQLTLSSTSPYATNSLTIYAGNNGTSNTLNLNGGTMSFTAGSLVMSQGGAYTISNGTLGASGAALTINQNSYSPLTVSSSISGGAGSLIKTGTGTVILSGTNSFTGGLTVQAGTINTATFTNASTSGPLGSVASITLGGSGTAGTLEYTGASTSSNMPIVTAAGGGGIQVDNAATTLTLSGNVSGPSFTKSGPGTINLTSTGLSATGFAVSGGTLQTTGAINTATVTLSNGAAWQMFTTMLAVTPTITILFSAPAAAHSSSRATRNIAGPSRARRAA